MFKTIWNHEELNSTNPLSYFINATACKIKIQNSSKFALDVYIDTEHVDRVEPYSFSVLPNGNYSVKVNRTVVSKNVQDNELVTFKTVGEETNVGSTTFTGTTNVSGDMNVTGGQIDAYIQGDINLSPDTQVNAQIVGDVNLASGTIVQAEITNPEINVSGTVNANIEGANINANINGTVPITITDSLVNTRTEITNELVNVSGSVAITSGSVNANIQNANLKADIINNKIGTNELVLIEKVFGDFYPTNEAQWIRAKSIQASIFDTIFIKVYGTLTTQDTVNGGEIVSDEISVNSISSISTLINGQATENPVTMNPVRGTYNPVASGTLPNAEPVDEVMMWLELSTLPMNFVGCEVIIEVYGFNSDDTKATKPDYVEIIGIPNVNVQNFPTSQTVSFDYDMLSDKISERNMERLSYVLNATGTGDVYTPQIDQTKYSRALISFQVTGGSGTCGCYFRIRNNTQGNLFNILNLSRGTINKILIDLHAPTTPQAEGGHSYKVVQALLPNQFQVFFSGMTAGTAVLAEIEMYK